MPLSSVKIEVDHCADAKHAQDELVALAAALAAEDTRLEKQMTNEDAVTTFSDPEIVCEVMKDDRPLWKGRLSVQFYTVDSFGVSEADVSERQSTDTSFGVFIPGLRPASSKGYYTIRRDMPTESQVDMFGDWASDEGYSTEIIAEGKERIRRALGLG